MQVLTSADAILADGRAIGRWLAPDEALVGDDHWTYGTDGTVAHLHASTGGTTWFHARGSLSEWRMTTPSGSFELETREDIRRGAFGLEGDQPFGRIEPLDGAGQYAPMIVVPDTMPIAEVVFVLWCARRIVRERGVVGALAATTAANAAIFANIAVMVAVT